MAKAPKNKSLAWSVLASGSVAVFGYQLIKFFGGNIAPVDTSPLTRFGSALTFGAACLYVGHDHISSLPQRRFRVTCENTGLYIERESAIRLPKLRRKERQPWGWRLWYKIPIGLCKTQFDEKQEPFENALDAEISFAYQRGLLRVDVLTGEIPHDQDYEPVELTGDLPFIVGVGRAGMIVSDLTACPHLLVAGQTGAGKSNFLHTLVACLLKTDAILHIIDLKRVEFSYLKKHVNVKYDLSGSIETLIFLTKEMHRRMKFLDDEGYVNAKEWRRDNPDRIKELPYHVLIVDEFSQLCPVLAKEKTDKEVRTLAHKLLVDLICLARSLGIHIVIATQYPLSDILPGQLKANIPATICFKVRTETNSRVCLDNNRASLLPSHKETPGRAIWQHDEEREVQTLHLPIKRARAHLFSKTPLPPLPSSSHAGRFNVMNNACPITDI